MGAGRRALIRLFDRTAEVLAASLVVALLLDVAAGVVTRAWGDPLDWTDEGARLLMVWLAMLGWIIASRRRAHVRIRFVQDHLPGPARRMMERLIQAGLMLLGAAAAWYGVELVGRNLDLDATSLPVSMAWFYIPLVPAGIVTALQAAGEMARVRA